MRIGNPSSSLTITLAVNTLELHQFSLWVLLQPMCHKWYSDTVNIYNLTKLTYFYLKWQSQGIQTLHSKRYLIIAVPVGHNSSSDELSVFHPHLYIFYRFTCTSVYTRIIICLQCSYLNLNLYFVTHLRLDQGSIHFYDLHQEREMSMKQVKLQYACCLYKFSPVITSEGWLNDLWEGLAVNHKFDINNILKSKVSLSLTNLESASSVLWCRLKLFFLPILSPKDTLASFGGKTYSVYLSLRVACGQVVSPLASHPTGLWWRAAAHGFVGLFKLCGFINRPWRACPP